MFKNLTPHEIVIHHWMGQDSQHIVPTSGQVARVSVARTKYGTIDGVPVYQETYGQVVDLPEPEAGTDYLVSAMVRQAVPDRRDVYSPGTLVRDDKGVIVGCRDLIGNGGQS